MTTKSIEELETTIARYEAMLSELHGIAVNLAYSLRVPFDEKKREEHLQMWEKYVLDSPNWSTK